jgi:hypothetical protein
MAICLSSSLPSSCFSLLAESITMTEPTRKRKRAVMYVKFYSFKNVARASGSYVQSLHFRDSVKCPVDSLTFIQVLFLLVWRLKSGDLNHPTQITANLPIIVHVHCADGARYDATGKRHAAIVFVRKTRLAFTKMSHQGICQHRVRRHFNHDLITRRWMRVPFHDHCSHDTKAQRLSLMVQSQTYFQSDLGQITQQQHRHLGTGPHYCQ